MTPAPIPKPSPGDPLLVIRELAAQVAAKGIKHVSGRVLVDATLFPEGGREDGTQAVISPICVNDNIIDLTVSPGATEGAPVAISVSPATAYVTFVNQAVTAPANSKPNIQPPNETANPDGSYTVTVTGTFPLGKAPILYAYDVPAPSRFAQVAFAEALAKRESPPPFRHPARKLTSVRSPRLTRPRMLSPNIFRRRFPKILRSR